MNRLLAFLSIILLMLIGVSCQSDNETGLSGDSGFKISLQEDAEIETRTVPNGLAQPVLTNFTLKIVNQSGHTVYDGKYTDRTIAASPGQYDLSAAYGDNPLVALDAPYYAGTAQASVSLGQTTPVTISCGVANALTSVVFKNDSASEANFDKDFKSYAVRVSVAEDETHSYSVDITNDGKSAYYRASSIPTYTFVATLQDGTPYSQPLTHPSLSDPSNFAAKSHCIITLSAGKIDAGLKVKVEQVAVEQVSISETIPVEWLPKPKVEGFADNQLSIVETETVTAEQASIQLKTATPLQELKMKFNFGDERYAILNPTKDKEFYQLSNPEDKQTIETTLGIQLPDVGATGAVIDFAPLANALLTKDGATVTNTIELDVQANNRWSSEDESANRIYTLTCTKPEFTISVDPLNCWSWEFLVNEATITSGNAEKIKADLKYQYLDGDQWKNCQTRSGEKGPLQQFTIDNSRKYVYLKDSPLERTYKVRALYREAIASNEETVTLEEPWQLPNSDMEEWISSERYGQPYYQPWQAGSIQWWDTNNNETMRKEYLIYPDYKTFPTVTYTDDGYKGKAAVIRTIAANNGVASEIMGGTPYRGKLFIGVSKDDGNYTEGRTFSSRPTAVSFYYKYESYNNENCAVYIDLMNGDQVVYRNSFISEKQSVNQFTSVTIPINYDALNLNPISSIRLRCYSVEENTSPSVQKQTINIPAGSRKVYSGSCLTVDNFELIYDK